MCLFRPLKYKGLSGTVPCFLLQMDVLFNSSIFQARIKWEFVRWLIFLGHQIMMLWVKPVVPTTGRRRDPLLWCPTLCTVALEQTAKLLANCKPVFALHNKENQKMEIKTVLYYRRLFTQYGWWLNQIGIGIVSCLSIGRGRKKSKRLRWYHTK